MTRREGPKWATVQRPLLSASLALGLTLALVPMGSPAVAAAERPRNLPTSCNSALAVAERFGATPRSTAEADVIVFGGVPVRVAGSEVDYSIYRDEAPTWSAWFWSWAWLVTWVRDGDPSRAVDIAVAWSRGAPDPGLKADRKVTTRSGWSEGMVTQRTETITCLWAATRDERLIPVMEALAKANLDPDRYYGRPGRPPHNHGAMANFALLRAGTVFDRPDWVSAAFARFTRDFPEVFAECGAHAEQSAPYLVHNHKLWTRVVRTAERFGQVGLADMVASRLRSVDQALSSLTIPGGLIAGIGNGTPTRGFAPMEGAPEHWWCEDRGWAAGRDDWTAPSFHYTLRFGPAVRFHGHDDHGSMTWWVAAGGGVEVLVDRGNRPKDTGIREREWYRSKAAHNTFSPSDVDYNTRSAATRQFAPEGAVFEVRDRHGRSGTERVRNLRITSDTLTVRDTGKSTEGRMWKQVWHLHPDWKVYGGDEPNVVARHPQGLLLTLDCQEVQGENARKLTPRVTSTNHYPAGKAALTLTCQVQGKQALVATTVAVVERP